MNIEPSIQIRGGPFLGSRKNLYEYSPVAIRESLVNAIAHRDYFYDSSHVYVHMFPDYIEIENPGGLFRGLTVEELGKRSIRRNRLIADLLHRAGFVERVGSGFSRMKMALEENNNPPLEVSATNFFNIRFYKRVEKIDTSLLTQRQLMTYRLLCDNEYLGKKELANRLQISEDTMLRELNRMIELNAITRSGVGKAITYRLV